jgi:RNA 3'-terminal phosphate cyclase (ATP)
MIELDGAMGEGGGQILRTSLALSLLTKKPFHLRNIRAKRSKPGLQAQHLSSVQAASAVGQGKLRGASLGSTDLFFEPGEVSAGAYHFRIGTAGATSLVLHTVYLPLALAAGPSTVTIEGGTHVKASPCFHFLQSTWRGYMATLGLGVELRMLRPGFFPRGGGLIEARLAGDWKPTVDLTLRVRQEQHAERDDCGKPVIYSAVAGLPESIARRQAERAYQELKRNKLKADVQYETWDGGPGTMLAVELPTRPVPTLFFGLGERGKPAERVADEAVKQVLAFVRAKPPGIDAHSADQILLPLAVSPGAAEFRVAEITQHLLTNIATIGQFLEREIACEGTEGDAGNVKVGAQSSRGT